MSISQLIVNSEEELAATKTHYERLLDMHTKVYELELTRLTNNARVDS